MKFKQKKSLLVKKSALLLIFSAYKNGMELFKFEIAAKTSNSRIDCLNGIRVISTIWIIILHIGTVLQFVPLENRLDMQMVNMRTPFLFVKLSQVKKTRQNRIVMTNLFLEHITHTYVRTMIVCLRLGKGNVALKVISNRKAISKVK